jgi:hypothetical protein
MDNARNIYQVLNFHTLNYDVIALARHTFHQTTGLAPLSFPMSRAAKFA